MSRTEKLLSALLNHNRAFTWQELETLLSRLGYSQVQGKGSRIKFDNGDAAAMISLHRPHPGNELKPYIRRQIIEHLKTGGYIP